LNARKGKPWMGLGLTHGLLLVGAFVSALPFLWMITTSLKPESTLYQAPLLVPTHFQWENYLKAWHAAPFPRFFLNSLVMTAGIVMGQTLFSAMAGYAFARLRFPGRDLLLLLVLGTMMIPFPVTLIPSFLVVNALGWVDTYNALIIPRAVSAFAIFLFRQFFLSLPKELEEAALIDGASRLGIFFRIVLPLSTPVLAASAVFSFLFAWNDFLWPLIVTNSTEMRTVQLGLAVFQGQYGIFWTLLTAAATIVTFPAILAFLAAQRQFIAGITSTGLKE